MAGSERVGAEGAWLFRLAGATGPEAVRVPTGFSWAEAIRLANREKAIPVLFRECRRLGVEGLTPDQSRQLQEATLRSAARMSYLEQRLEALLAVYNREGIRVLLLKGAALALTVYRSFPERPMADLDLLVDPARADEAWQLAKGAGWTGPDRQTEAYQAHHHLPPLDDAQGSGLGLELHTDVLAKGSPFRFGGADLWKGAVEIEAGGHRAYVASDADLILHLCIHFAWSHAMIDAAWRTFRDLHTLIAAGRVDWSELVRRAGEARAVTCVYWTLRLAQRLSGVAVPSSVLQELSPPGGEAVRGAVERYFTAVLCRPSQWHERTRVVGRTMWRAGMRPGWSGLGKVRPWDRDQLFAAERRAQHGGQPRPEEAPVALERLRQLARELRTLAPW